METYTFTHTPDPATLRRDLVADQAARLVPATLTALCTSTAADFRAMATWCYSVGDETRGDKFTAYAGYWEMAAESGNLRDVAP